MLVSLVSSFYRAVILVVQALLCLLRSSAWSTVSTAICLAAHALLSVLLTTSINVENTGDVAALKQPSRESARKLDDLHKQLIFGLVAENQCIYLSEICQVIYEATFVKLKCLDQQFVECYNEMDSQERKFVK